MELLVCLKQVPDMAEGMPDPELGLVFPDNVTQEISALDRYALEAAARLQDSCPDCSITLLSLDGETALRDGYAVVGEQAVLVWDPAFEGSDPVGKGLILAEAARVLEERQGRPFDLILCGQQSADLGSGLTGPSLAEALGRPAVGSVLTAEYKDGCFHFQREIGRGIQIVEADGGCVALVTRSDRPLRYPTILRKMTAVEMELPELHGEDLSALDRSRTGQEGACMRIVRRFAPPAKEDAVRIQATSGEEAAQELLRGLEWAKVL
ncbi:hypothetical protein LCR02_13265 [Flavonifractor plautii]|uniref:electron transfer flavoprotein subunit beta/FixA family protein n=1 Tax=Flavonifractor plautii TaxID=292800 RepID=UPI001CD52945|nr:hypothetical protein [Flavonifractor plautii]UBS59873.1 hypothetical protein LCR02_13265 [Flavonifractor plautii]